MPLPSAATSAAFPESRRAAWDDWEDGYTRDEQTSATQNPNVRLWQQANTFQPTYSILPVNGATRAPPAAALNAATTNGPPVLKILKRPPNPTSSSSNAGLSRPTSGDRRQRSEKTLAEREKEYLEARRRIYGEDSAALEVAQAGVAKMSLGKGSTRSSSSSSSGGPRAMATAAGSPARASSASPVPHPNSRRGTTRSPAASVQNLAASASAASTSELPTKQGVARQPKGPNAQSGGFGFGAGSASAETGSNPSSRSSSRGSRRAR
ncbi:hypothetical protein JCM10908_004824 [Rhodotorula pacifica]|uniref:SUZ domain-containing protein n=1 Tax=Rhodotorula pacifica TaxID=1495444 RepID=UPI00317652FB